MARRALVAALAIAAAALAACGGDPALPPTGVTLTLGGAGDGGTWTDLVDGQDVTLVEGAQGGFHVWLKFRVAGMGAEKVLAAKIAHRASDGAPVLRSSAVFEVGDAPQGGYWELPMPTPMFMCPTPIGVRVADEKIVYELDLTTESGAPLASQRITLVPHCPAQNDAFCMRICTG